MALSDEGAVTVGSLLAEGLLAISPNNGMPAIVDPDGPDGQLIWAFESGIMLQYRARKTGQFYGEAERGRVNIDQWVMWLMVGLGPMAGQTHHFRQVRTGHHQRHAPDRPWRGGLHQRDQSAL